jgi:uncharacterized protein
MFPMGATLPGFGMIAEQVSTVAGTALEINTPHGPARAHLRPATGAVGALVLGHGAGGGVSARDLLAAAGAAAAQRFTVALVEQPYRVAGRRSPAPAHQLDAGWTAVLARLREDELRGVPVVCGGRSSGARVACRTAADTGVVAVLCLAFPLEPPRRGRASAPPRSRQDELDAVTVPTLVVQGESDPFGMPAPGPNRRVVTVPGNHSLRGHLDRITAAVGEWLLELPIR